MWIASLGGLGCGTVVAVGELQIVDTPLEVADSFHGFGHGTWDKVCKSGVKAH